MDLRDVPTKELVDVLEIRGELETENLLSIIAKRGGAEGACAEAALLFHRKGKDYNTGVQRDEYFPFGLQSYAQMLWVKVLRLLSFCMHPREAKHESVRDTLLDLISYAAFAADWLKRQSKQEGAERNV